MKPQHYHETSVMKLLVLFSMSLLVPHASAVPVPLRHLRLRHRDTVALEVSDKVGDAKRTWDVLGKAVDEPDKRVGMEFELNWVTGNLNQPGSRGHIDQAWAEANGHLAVYKGAKDWANWEVHLDGGVWPELVLNPVDKPTLVTELKRMKNALLPVFNSPKWKTFVTKMETDGQWVKNPDVPDAVFVAIKKFTVSTQASARPVGSPQVTSTYTIDEMKASNGMGKVVYSAIGSPADDEAERAKLYSTPFQVDAKLGESVLVKQLAEQLGPDSGAVNIDTPPKPAQFPDEGIDKVKTEYGLHTMANKVTHMFKRGGKPAYLIEIRKKNGYQAWFDAILASMKDTTRDKFSEIAAQAWS